MATQNWLTVATSTNYFDVPLRISMMPVVAQQIGAVSAVDLPRVGSVVEAGAQCGVVVSAGESTGLYSPVTGRVTIVNDAVSSDPGLAAADPTGAGWLFAVLPSRG
ncbi:glycine cleavage system protein H [Antrihabitans stalactiti]|uniref:Glycine cleavage system protein H n=1 Tax=Antrihabitans stalactiti TaxID=2584121 RepID=A0A848KHV3_9NOCA|nr:glycine cleavage system protein H [Antrihabitans stalactiti]NMN96282.1 glycine cleavage system protein H [Antrihabitans stalactiti]